MRITQTISIGRLTINTMSNSSVLQVGASGAIKAHSETITENIPQPVADQKLEKKITKEVKPILNKEGLPVEPPGTGPNGGANGGTGYQPGFSGPGGYAPPYSSGDYYEGTGRRRP